MAVPLAVARRCFEAFVAKDRAAIEALIAPDYRFTSPLDNALERAAYFLRCWPNSEAIEAIKIIHQAEEGSRAFVVYEARLRSGKRFQNCEAHIVRDGKLVSTEVYFGWDLPHKAPAGGSVADESGASG